MQDQQQSQTYNGWTNYATWGVCLVLDNDEGTYNACREMARHMHDAAPTDSRVIDGIWTEQQSARFELADWLKEFTEQLCGLEGEDYGISEPSLMAKQVIQAGLSDVNWDEIADHYLEDLS